jgi:hypothetical protein
MYPTASSPQYAFGSGLAPVPMPVYKRGGEVKETYGLDNIAEMIRQRGRGRRYRPCPHIPPRGWDPTTPWRIGNYQPIYGFTRV